MDYKIVCDGKLIAEFLHAQDRDVCMKLLQEMYSDCEFVARGDDDD